MQFSPVQRTNGQDCGRRHKSLVQPGAAAWRSTCRGDVSIFHDAGPRSMASASSRLCVGCSIYIPTICHYVPSTYIEMPFPYVQGFVAILSSECPYHTVRPRVHFTIDSGSSSLRTATANTCGSLRSDTRLLVEAKARILQNDVCRCYRISLMVRGRDN